MTVRYRLDDLGWFQFEQLVQSTLKAELGLGVESWGERRDFGRDVYCETSLNFPSKHLTEDGPFIFQAKFVENANAAGADYDDLLTAAVRKEIARIEERMSKNVWTSPKHYCLVTNAQLSATLRKAIGTLFEASFPSVGFHSLGGNDICDLLDNNPNLRRSFPQLLGLRDLDELLTQVVSRELIERSRSAIEEARDIVPVFVPTAAYEKTWSVLKKYHFAVLEGPPEMGKTSIAWMIALSQISQGWQAVVCDDPRDIFETPATADPQIFIADDAFGRTEYDPGKGSKWETQLHRIFRRLDARHWLIWTSRKHILERACRRLDLQGQADRFPSPGAVLVNAADLSRREKALILYRHARAVGLEEEAKTIVRKYAKSMVNDKSFTPERIRRLVKEILPGLARELKAGTLDDNQVSVEIREAIRNPTDQMRKAFRALDNSYKWVLFSLLEAGYLPQIERVKQLYEAHCPTEDRRPFDELIEELTEGFIKTHQYLY